MAHVVSIVYRPRKSGRPHDRFERVSADRVQLVESQGIEGDLKGTRDRQLNIMLAETLAELGAEGFQVGPGQMGEQIVIAGLGLAILSESTRLRLGEAVVEIGIPRTGCARFEQIQGKSRRDADGRLGFMAAVVAGGTVAVGSAVEVIA
jgi:MOSC domain-containing protein YiiM